MPASEAQIRANQMNAQKSTGPRTPEGKARSRANALKHGLTSSVVVAEDLEAIQSRTAEWFFALKPQNEYQGWLVDKLAVCSLRIDRAERMERRYRDRKSLSAELSWDDDFRMAAERLGGRIGKDPAGVVEDLRRTPVGCDWLISRWAMLAHAADFNERNEWTAEQMTLAFHLRGTPTEFRQGRRPFDALDEHGHVTAAEQGHAALARREVDALLARRDEVAEMDEVDRALAESDLFDEHHPALKNLRRYEGTLHNRLRWYLSEMKYVSPHLRPNRELTERKIVFNENPAEPKPAPPPVSAAKTRAILGEVSPWEVTAAHPPITIEAGEVPADGSSPDAFKVLLNRHEKRERKVESRREARERKREKLRA